MAYGTLTRPGSEYSMTANDQDEQRKQQAVALMNSRAIAVRTGGGGGGINSFDPAAPAAPAPDVSGPITGTIPGASPLSRPAVAQQPIAPSQPATGNVQTPAQTAVSSPVSVPPVSPVQPSFNNVQSGATRQPLTRAAATLPGAVSQGGRQLGYGQMVNGVATFSDGSGLPGAAVPRTMTDQQITDLGGRLTIIPSASFQNPGLGVSGAGTPTEAQGVAVAGLTRPSLTGALPYDAQGDVDETQRNAISDITSILSKDPRSPLGVAARNLSVDLPTTLRRGGRYGGQASGPYEQAISELIGGVNAGAHANTTAALDRSRQDNALQLAGNRDASEVQREGIRQAGELNKPTYQTDANGNLVLVRGATAEPVSTGGKPLAVQGKLNGPQDATYRDAYSKAYAAHITNGDDEEAASEKAIAAAQKAVGGMKSAGGQATTKISGTATATGPNGQKLKLSDDGKSWVPAQ